MTGELCLLTFWEKSCFGNFCKYANGIFKNVSENSENLGAMLSAAVCDAWRTVGSPSNRLRRAKCLKADSSTAIPPAPHLSVPRSLPYTSVQTRTSPCRRRCGGSWRTQTENFGEGDSRAGVRRRIGRVAAGRPPPEQRPSEFNSEKPSTSFLPWKRKWAFRRKSVRRVACFEISLPSAFPLRTKGPLPNPHSRARKSALMKALTLMKFCSKKSWPNFAHCLLHQRIVMSVFEVLEETVIESFPEID